MLLVPANSHRKGSMLSVSLNVFVFKPPQSKTSFFLLYRVDGAVLRFGLDKVGWYYPPAHILRYNISNEQVFSPWIFLQDAMGTYQDDLARIQWAEIVTKWFREQDKLL